jgi:hypothetical protein
VARVVQLPDAAAVYTLFANVHLMLLLPPLVEALAIIVLAELDQLALTPVTTVESGAEKYQVVEEV